jgi:hypothetical protein
MRAVTETYMFLAEHDATVGSFIEADFLRGCGVTRLVVREVLVGAET